MHLFESISRLKSANKKVVAVGTTVCRSLESLPYVWREMRKEDKEKYTSETQIYWDTLTQNIESKNFIHNLSINYPVSAITFSTSIYIYPGSVFHVVDDLITNFHLPESSLLVLISAFIGKEETKDIYKKAIEKQYRFFSFGDGMYIKSA